MICFPELLRGCINSGCVLCEFIFKFVLHFAHIGHYAVVKQVGKMCHAVKNPKSSVVFVVQNVAIAFGPGFGHTVDAAVKRNINGCSGIVHSKPVDSANGVGQPVAHLRDE